MAPRRFEGSREGARLKIAIVVSRFNHEITQKLLSNARARLTQLGVSEADIEIIWVPGAFEIPQVVKLLANSQRYDGILPLGCVIRGETAHFEHIARTVFDGLMRLTIECATPIVFGVLTVYTEEQAWARIEKGTEVAESLVELISLRRLLPADL